MAYKAKHKVLNLRETIKKEHINVLGYDFHEKFRKNNRRIEGIES